MQLKKKCEKCQNLRARLVLWLAIKLGVMVKDEPKQPIPIKLEPSMQNFGLDELMCIIGNKEVEIIALRRELAQAEQRIAELTPKTEPLAVVKKQQP